MPRRTLAERFYAKVDPDPNGGCWKWTAATSRGYGMFQVRGQKKGAHRVAYELLVGPIPDGLTLDHLCRNRGCVNPTHLEPVTLAENVRRAFPSTDTHCRHGHPWADDNVYVNPKGCLVCRECVRTSMRRHRARKAAA